MTKISKTTAQKLIELEDHVSFVADALEGLLRGEPAKLRQLAAELRVLICLSSGTEGLLWRLVEELGADDTVELHRVFASVDKSHPLARGLRFALVPLALPGRGDPRLPVEPYSFREVIKTGLAVFVDDKGFTHETLIKLIAQQVGSAHEDDTVSPELAHLSAMLVGDAQPFFPILVVDALLTFTVTERVLTRAILDSDTKYRRTRSAPDETAYRLRAFAAQLDLPKLNPVDPEEGTLALAFRGNDATFTAGPIRIEVRRTRLGPIELKCSGLFVGDFVCTEAAPLLSIGPPGEISIALTWRRPHVNIYFNGHCVKTLPE